MLVKSVGFSFVAGLSPAAGVGANTAIVSLVDARPPRPLPTHDPRALVVSTTDPRNPRGLSRPFAIIGPLVQNAVFFG